MNRGSGRQLAALLARVMRFNEAPIHESGKCAPALGARRGVSTGFNEAPIHESGKSASARSQSPER